MERKFIISAIIGALFFFVLGGGLGVYYASEAGGVPGSKAAVKTQAVQTLSSKVIPSITAYGQVSKIDGKNITLNYGGDSLTIKLRDDAQIFFPSTATTPQKMAKFEDIKVGQNVSMNIKLLPDGQIEGQLVIILQPAK